MLPVVQEQAPPRTKRVRDAVATEKRILDTAEEMFARRGLDAVTTKEIAAGAGVAIGAMYHHFASKDAIYAAVVKRAFGGATALPAELHDECRPAEERLEALTLWYIRALVDNATFRGLLTREVLDPRSDMPQLLDREIFSEPLALFHSLAGEVAPEMDVELAIVSLFALIFGLTSLRSLTGSYPAVELLTDAEQIAAHAIRVIFHGLT